MPWTVLSDPLNAPDNLAAAAYLVVTSFPIITGIASGIVATALLTGDGVRSERDANTPVQDYAC